MNGQASHSGSELSRGLAECTLQAWKVYKSLAFAPEALRDVQAGALSLEAAWRLIVEFSHQNQIPSVDARTLRDHIIRSNTVVNGVTESLERLGDGREEIEDVAKFEQKLIIQAARITSFYEILRRPTQERILTLLEEMREVKSEDFQQSRVRSWPFVLEELQKFGLSEDSIKEEYFFISNWLKESYLEPRSHEQMESNSIVPPAPVQISSSSSAPRIEFLPSGAELDDELPEYTPGKKPANVAEKVQDLDRTTEILNLENPMDQPGSSSGALPPAYTFDTESDQEMDEEFTRYIKNAIGSELKRRVYERDLHPERGPSPYSWLPKSMQVQYARRSEVFTMLDGKSFTVMGYETAPWCLEEIDRLLPVLRMSSDGTGDNTTFNEGVRTLKIMANTLHKFGKIQDQRAGTQLFSDLDILDYEASTAIALEKDLQFPENDFDLAQKSYYLLLTYMMGMLSLMKDIFPGKTYVTRSREDLEQLWRDRRMAARTAWIEKQMTGWDHVEQAILKCRDWHRLRPYLCDDAIAALKQWQQAQDILASHTTKDDMVLTIISASGIPKSRMGLPNIMVKVVLYGSNTSKQAHACFRRLEVFTDSAKNTQFPVWNKVVPFTCPIFPKMLDLEIYDRGGIKNKEISRVRLNFTHIPGAERTFAGRSMMFGLDEEIRLPFKIHEGKGKETEQPILLIRLQWEGRFTQLENSGLIMSAPGKMFRPNFTGIPLPFDDDSELSVRDDRSRRSGSIASGNAAVAVEGAVGVANATVGVVNILGSL